MQGVAQDEAGEGVGEMVEGEGEEVEGFSRWDWVMGVRGGAFAD